MSIAPHPAAALPVVDAEEIDRLLDEGRVLPAQFYTDPAVAELEERLIFRTSWQVACAEIELKAPGDFVTLTIASVPILVVRDNEGEIRAHVNVCRHRGSRVVNESEGNCARLQCPYHGWTYRLDGSLQGAPNFKEGLPPFETLGLRSVSVDTFAGLVFVCVEPTQSLQEQLGDLPRLMEDNGYGFAFASGDLEGGVVFEGEQQHNWKLYNEGSSECYHCPTTHDETFCRLFKPSEVELKVFDGGFQLRLPLSNEMLAMCDSDEARRTYGFDEYFIWPNTFILTGHVGEQWWRVEPAGPRRTRLVGHMYRRPGHQSPEMAELVDDLYGMSGAEDARMMEAVQAGLESGFFESGPTLPEREVALRALHRNAWNALKPALSA